MFIVSISRRQIAATQSELNTPFLTHGGFKCALLFLQNINILEGRVFFLMLLVEFHHFYI